MVQPRMRWCLLAVLAFAAVAGAMGTGLAAMPPADTPIGNQATATYTDASGVIRTVTSNAVITYVQAVYGLALESDQVRQPTPTARLPSR